jgi:hypothetical protein
MSAAEVPERIAKFGSMSNLKGDNLCSGPLFFGLNYRSRTNVTANPGCPLQLFDGPTSRNGLSGYAPISLLAAQKALNRRCRLLHSFRGRIPPLVL